MQRKKPPVVGCARERNTVPGEGMVRRRSRSAFAVSSALVLAMLSGCATIGPKKYESSFSDYNDAIRRTSDGQMLANLVRMRYLESPIFLQVASVSTSFNLSLNAGASATLNEGGADSAGLNAGAAYSETPTITFSLPESRGYYGLLMAPLSSNQILQLIDAGFDSGAVLRTGVRSINGLKNVSIETSTYPVAPRSYDDFVEALALIERLNFEGFVEFAPSSGFALWSTPIGPIGDAPLAQAVLAAATIDAKNAGGDLVENADGRYELHIFSRRMALRFSAAAIELPDAQRLKSLLQLDPERNAYPMFDYEFTKIEKARSYVGQVPASLDPEAVWDEIGLRGRSMMEIMQIASTTVQVPQEDIDLGVVFVDPAASSGPERPSLVIKSSEKEPTNASIRIRYRGHWFYIEDNDLASRESFILLNAMFAVTAGTVPGASPILTLPVR